MDYAALSRVLLARNTKEAKKLITAENVCSRDARGRGIVWYLCYGLYEPNIDVLNHSLNLGASLETCRSLHQIAFKAHRDFLLVARILIDRGTPVDAENDNGETPLFISLRSQNYHVAKFFIDAGAKVQDGWGETTIGFIPYDWALTHVATREYTRKGCVILLGLQRTNAATLGRNGKDALRLIARCLWSARGIEQKFDLFESHGIGLSGFNEYCGE